MHYMERATRGTAKLGKYSYRHSRPYWSWKRTELDLPFLFEQLAL
jgi:hypothetical protein